jgi:hypothetical protein
MKELPFRQIHLDFHTSPFIPGVGSDFDAEKFVSTLKQANVNAINVFAKCHHGMCYYPTAIGRQHPSLQKDLLGEMLGVLKRESIQAVIYFPVGWEEEAARNVSWLEVNREGKLGSVAPFEERNYKWRKLCLNKKGYVDYVLSQIEELLEMYDFNGFWFDIIFQQQCHCNDCIEEMYELGLNPQDSLHVRKHDFLALKKFQERVLDYVKSRKPDALVFFNGHWRPDGGHEKEYTIEERSRLQTHVEIESLPSEIWGYNHFPLYVNFHNRHNGEIVGMNGKFHTAWGDFGSLRNQEALEFECFRMIANGSRCCIGDQMHPKAYLDQTVYRRIGNVYAQIKEREPWCSQSEKVSQIGVLMATPPLNKPFEPDEGVLRMLLELHYSFDFIPRQADFSKYDLLIMPDLVPCDAELASKLTEYLRNGGKLLASYHSGMDELKQGFVLDELGVSYEKENEYSPSYMVIEENSPFHQIEPYEYVMYERGTYVLPKAGAEVLAPLGKPYFNRSYNRFCSHRHTPYEQKEEYPAIVRNGNAVYIANPLFTDYIKHGPRIYREIIADIIEQLLPKPLIRTDLPVSAEVTLRKQEHRMILHILHYIAERKSKKLDIIDTKIPLINQTVEMKTAAKPRKVYLAPSGQELAFDWDNGYTQITVPEIFGHVMVVLEE